MSIYFRLHWSDCPDFHADNAASVAWGCHGDSDFAKKRGYSCFEHPGKLIDYFCHRGEPEADQRVVVFRGQWQSLGDDGEDLVVPSSVVLETTWGELTRVFRRGETIYDTIHRVCRENGIDDETAELIATRDIDTDADLIAAYSDLAAFCIEKNAEWNAEV